MKISKTLLWTLMSISIIVICILNGILSIGDRIMRLSTHIGILFYILIAGFLFYISILPVLRIVLTPEIKFGDSIDEETRNSLRCQVKDSAKASLLVTTLSQSSTIDLFANITIVFSLIGKLVRQAGFRPSILQLIRLYYSILITSLFVASTDELFDSIDFGKIIGNSGIGSVCKLLQPLTNGVANAYLCLRLGYATINYLEMGNKKYWAEKGKIRKITVKEARKELPGLIKEEIIDIVKRTT